MSLVWAFAGDRVMVSNTVVLVIYLLLRHNPSTTRDLHSALLRPSRSLSLDHQTVNRPLLAGAAALLAWRIRSSLAGQAISHYPLYRLLVRCAILWALLLVPWMVRGVVLLAYPLFP